VCVWWVWCGGGGQPTMRNANGVHVHMMLHTPLPALCRGLSAAASAHGLGTAALGSAEPEALPFAALSYAMCGTMASLLASVPLVQEALLGITG
jgi:putative effector of murein hydrolase